MIHCAFTVKLYAILKVHETLEKSVYYTMWLCFVFTSRLLIYVLRYVAVFRIYITLINLCTTLRSCVSCLHHAY